MKISTGLTRLKNLKSRIAQTDSYVYESINYYEDDKPDAVYLDELKTHDDLIKEIRTLKIAIQVTNCSTTLSYKNKSVTISELILLNADFRSELSFYSGLLANGSGGMYRHRRNKDDVSMKVADGYDKIEIRKTIRTLEDDREQLEGILSGVNLQTEITGI